MTANTVTVPDTAVPPRIRLTRADQIPHRRVTWLWADRIPHGSLVVVAGREGIGKSSIVCDLAAQITRGTLEGEHLGRPRAVVFVASEDSWAMTIGPRMEAAGADMKNVYRADVDEGNDRITLPADIDELRRQVQDVKAALVVLDPLVSLVDDELDPHRDRDVRRALEPLAHLAEALGVVVTGVCHHGKRNTTDALNLVLGSRAWTAVPRAVLAVVRDHDAADLSCILAQAKNNLGRMDLPGLRFRIVQSQVLTADGLTYVGRADWLGEVDGDVRDLLRDRDGDPDSKDDKIEVAAWLKDYLLAPGRGGEAPAKDILKAAQADGFSRDQVKRAKRPLGVTSHKQGDEWVWRWPSDTGGDR